MKHSGYTNYLDELAREYARTALGIRVCTGYVRSHWCEDYERYDPQTGAGYRGCISEDGKELCATCQAIRKAIANRQRLRKRMQWVRKTICRVGLK